MTMSSGDKVAIGTAAAGGTVLVSLGYILSKKKGGGTGTGGGGNTCSVSSDCGSGLICFNGSCVNASLKLTASATDYKPGGSVKFTATLTSGGSAVANFDVVLNEKTSNTTAKQTTNSNGVATFDVSFPSGASGSYEFEASA